MPVERNKGKGPKVITYRLGEEEGDSELYALTFRMAKGLLSTVEYFQWMSRHLTLPSDLSDQQSLNDWVDELRQRLMQPFDPLAEICARIINCIETDTDVQDALRDFVLGDELINEAYDNSNVISGKGSPLLPEELIANPEEYGELWAQCVQLVEYTNDAIVQLLAVLEVQSNNAELIVHSMESIPMFKFILDAVPANSWIEFADYFIDVIGEEYDVGYDETVPDGSKWLIACELFCICKVDKTINIDRMWDAISNLLSGYAVPNWDNAQELVESLIGVNDNSQLVAYSCFGLMWGSAKLSSFIGLSTVTNKALSVILEIAKNDANDDYEELCTNCPTPDECGDLVDWKTGTHGWEPVLSGRAEHVPDEGWKRAPVNNSYIYIKSNMDGLRIKTVRLRLNQIMTGGSDYAVVLYNYDASIAYALSTDNHVEYNFTGLDIDDGLIVYVSSGALLPEPLRLEDACFTYHD